MYEAIKRLGTCLLKDIRKPLLINNKAFGYFSSWVNPSKTLVQTAVPQIKPLEASSSRALLPAVTNNLCLSRNVTKFSLKTGKKKSVPAVLTRFYRLNCGLWIRRRAGCHKRLWRKNFPTKYNLRQHVFCTKTQCIMLDKMITNHHKKRKFFIDDPFEPYHTRNNFDWVFPIRRR